MEQTIAIGTFTPLALVARMALRLALSFIWIVVVLMAIGIPVPAIVAIAGPIWLTVHAIRSSHTLGGRLGAVSVTLFMLVLGALGFGAVVFGAVVLVAVVSFLREVRESLDPGALALRVE